jgi:hypothetical protein
MTVVARTVDEVKAKYPNACFIVRKDKSAFRVFWTYRAYSEYVELFGGGSHE